MLYIFRVVFDMERQTLHTFFHIIIMSIFTHVLCGSTQLFRLQTVLYDFYPRVKVKHGSMSSNFKINVINYICIDGIQ